MTAASMSVESHEKLLVPSGTCAEQDSNADISVTPTITPQAHSLAYRDPKRPSTVVMLLSDWWYMELLCMVLSFAMFGFYCWFLHHMDGKKDAAAYFFIIKIYSNVGAAIAQMAVVLKLLMFVPVSSALGQLSWYRFLNTTSKPVADLQAYDAASRGLSGSVRFLLSKNLFKSPHATLGAVLTIASIYLASSMQNAVHSFSTSLRDPQDGQNASMPFANLFDRHPRTITTIVDESNDEIDTGMGAALYSAWLYNTNPQKANVPVSFLSTTCEVNEPDREFYKWEGYTTLAAKSMCRVAPATKEPIGLGHSYQANINSSVRAVGNHNASSFIPARLKFEASLKIPKTSSFASSFSDQSAVIIYLAAIADSGLPNIVATECVLNWQVQHVQNVALSSYTASTYNPLERSDSDWIYKPKISHPRIEDETIFEGPCNPKSGGSNCEYKVKRAATLQVQNYLKDFLSGYVLPESQNNTRFTATGKAMEVFAQPWIDSKDAGTQTSLNDTLAEYMSNLAEGITGYMLSTATNSTTGQILSFGLCEIAWYHIAYPLTMVVLSAYLLLFTMWWTRRMPVWKTSLLPFLYHGLQHPPYEQGYDLSSLGSMREMSNYQTVALRDEDDGLGLRLRNPQADIAS
ncbi:hypothetical protein CGMCC3_g17476 [Colletotrichum fructicola]|uniref:Uncharacterized protein n=1 Tax=Colletotrichum fructicola (strain Nara gc5) TaxID=1213859 RepID=L2GGD4_COLFN|nr:uncharacterized protein CGMCC3_g17476 [Colletotrichum fructicola]KAE9566361.1 hypothetical protein CGMCC3_g17476 [Colletotrichum fructicola]KAF4483627.1 hypothetical protein CGGC5_v007169 [Colletotrichum fructicola Nara gc5]